MIKKNRKMIFLIIPFLLGVYINKSISQNNSKTITLDSDFVLEQDTIWLDIKGEMTHALKYHDKFYVIFEQTVFKYGGQGKRYLYIFSDGEVEKSLECPSRMNAVYWDFFVKNDSIILKQYQSDVHFYFDTQNFTWTEIDQVDDLIFEDEKFYVYSLDFGEWGGKTWFKDKKTGIEYVTEATTPLVNKIDTTYYLTQSFCVSKITKPSNLNLCNDDVRYENIKATQRYHSWYGDSIGFDIVYQDPTYNYFSISHSPHIVSSFVWQNKLFHIYETDTTAYIAKAENNTIKNIQKIGENLSFYNRCNSYRCKNSNGNNELLKFHTKDEQSSGLIEIVNNRIFTHYLINKAELKPKRQGQSKADSIFVNRLDLILSNLDNLQLKTVDLSENEWGSFDITPNHKIGVGDSWNPNKYTIDTCKSYFIQEDSLISNSIIYYATKENDLVRTVIIDWEETDFLHFNQKELAKETFKTKLTFLQNHITEKAGEPSKSESGKNYTKKTWKTSDGLTIELNNMNNFNKIRLVIYVSGKDQHYQTPQNH